MQNVIKVNVRLEMLAATHRAIGTSPELLPGDKPVCMYPRKLDGKEFLEATCCTASGLLGTFVLAWTGCVAGFIKARSLEHKTAPASYSDCSGIPPEILALKMPLMDDYREDELTVSNMILFSQIYRTLAVGSIVFISAVSIAMIQSKAQRHPVIIVFLITSWFGAWISLIPVLFDQYIPNREDPHASNVTAGRDLRLCQLNAVLIAYAEVLRILLQLRHLKSPVSKSDDLEVQFEKDLNWASYNSTPMMSLPSSSTLDCGKLETSTSSTVVTRTWWHCALPSQSSISIVMVVMPFVTSAVAPVLVLISLASQNWSEVHTSILNPRLAALAAITAVGASIHWIIRIASLVKPSCCSFIEPLFMICFPLFGNALFVNKPVIEQFSSWFQSLRRFACCNFIKPST
ncbi:uncharacterized protein MELLADRAFT_117766 [Melampsora larici-populina 98AG31]|uniref:Uncharacterized protein n=1 Tax=Melampsora larici-populina (strain 98AG31 / pathotype 3-4-7) TaxID=747676 RepID=F4S1B8_MELLP|nr:uncharacterized protein MELLADRAFT_117766 [Melampsora larici-populina 98AG31]EGG01536.1 hypothetical protein MELLADRAFT_117766 [Melampsora larici-populina 98AG31]